MEVKKEFLAKLEELHPILSWIVEELKPMHFEISTIRKIELASEEVVVNIFRHAYQGLSEKIEIELNLVPMSHVELSFKDKGPPFDPTKQKIEVDLTSSLEERAIGGLGIYFIHKNMDEVRYSRNGEKNILTLVKKIPHPSHKK